MSSLSRNHQTHMNIVESRKAAVKFSTRETGRQYFVEGKRHTKAGVLTLIKTGMLDGFFYTLDFVEGNLAKRGVFFYRDSFNTYTRKIGN